MITVVFALLITVVFAPLIMKGMMEIHRNEWDDIEIIGMSLELTEWHQNEWNGIFAGIFA